MTPLPEAQQAQVLVRKNGEAWPGALIFLELRMSVKNHFGQISSPADSNGIVTVDTRAFLAETENDSSFFLMDYADPRTKGADFLTASPITTSDTRRALKAYELFCKYAKYRPGYRQDLDGYPERLLSEPAGQIVELSSVSPLIRVVRSWVIVPPDVEEPP